MSALAIEANGLVRGPSHELLGRITPALRRDVAALAHKGAKTFLLVVGRKAVYVHGSQLVTKEGMMRWVYWVHPQGDESPRKFFTLPGAVTNAVLRIKAGEDAGFFTRAKPPKKEIRKRT